MLKYLSTIYLESRGTYGFIVVKRTRILSALFSIKFIELLPDVAVVYSDRVTKENSINIVSMESLEGSSIELATSVEKSDYGWESRHFESRDFATVSIALIIAYCRQPVCF